MRKRVFLLFAILGLSGCAPSYYVLHWREPTRFWRFNFFSPPKENTPIAAQDGVALLYDRAPWVIVERELPDGSVWIHYALAIKNTTDRKIELDAKSVFLEVPGKKILAAFEREDLMGSRLVVDPKSYNRVTVKFLVPAEIVSQYENSKTPLHLVVSLQSRKDLRVALWLWEE